MNRLIKRFQRGVRWFDWLARHPQHRKGLWLLQICLGFALLFRAATEWRFALYLFGPSGIGAGENIARFPGIFGTHFGKWVEGAFATEAGTYAMLLLTVMAAVGFLAGRFTLVANVIAVVSVPVLNHRMPLGTDGGDNVMYLTLIYMLLTVGPKASPAPDSVRVWLHNIGVVAIALQSVLVYFMAGLAKANGDMWQHGVALYYVTQSGIFSNPLMESLFRNPFAVTAATYSVLFWELMFPMAIATRFKRPWIVIGLLFEIGVGYFMGLVTFSLVMIGLLLFLMNDDELEKLTALVSARLKALRTGIPEN